MDSHRGSQERQDGIVPGPFADSALRLQKLPRRQCLADLRQRMCDHCPRTSCFASGCSGRDICVCLVAAVLLSSIPLNVDMRGDAGGHQQQTPVTKMDVKRVMVRVTGVGSCPNPSRGHVKQIFNHFHRLRMHRPVSAASLSPRQISISQAVAIFSRIDDTRPSICPTI